MDPAHAELESLLNAPKSEEGTVPETPAPSVEQVEYYLGDKANKLPVDAQFAFTEDGKVIKAPLSTMLNHYRQRSGLDKKFSEFNKTREDFQNEQKQWGDLEPYRQLQKWSTEKPEEFQAIWDLYQNKDKHLLTQKASDPNSQALIDEMTNLKKELGGLKEFKTQFDKQREQEEDQKNLKELDDEVNSFKKEFPEINLDQESDMTLQSGQKATVKQAIMLFGHQNRIPDFESAALKYLKPKLLEVVGQRARTEAVKGVRQDNKQGVIARSSTPLNGQGSKVNPKASWGDATKAAKAELEAMLRG